MRRLSIQYRLALSSVAFAETTPGIGLFLGRVLRIARRIFHNLFPQQDFKGKGFVGFHISNLVETQKGE